MGIYSVEKSPRGKCPGAGVPYQSDRVLFVPSRVIILVSVSLIRVLKYKMTTARIILVPFGSKLEKQRSQMGLGLQGSGLKM